MLLISKVLSLEGNGALDGVKRIAQGSDDVLPDIVRSKQENDKFDAACQYNSVGAVNSFSRCPVFIASKMSGLRSYWFSYRLIV